VSILNPWISFGSAAVAKSCAFFVLPVTVTPETKSRHADEA
jgi:hypothetical protein